MTRNKKTVEQEIAYHDNMSTLCRDQGFPLLADSHRIAAVDLRETLRLDLVGRPRGRSF